MGRYRLLACSIALATLALPQQAAAQAGTVKLRSIMNMSFDCEDPWRVTNYGVTGNFTATLNPDSTATADLKISGFFLDGDVHFDARLGRASPAPGGTSQLRVTGRNRLRGVWSLPNNNMSIDITVSGQTCNVNLTVQLKPGKRQYTMFGGQKFYYCSAARVVSTSCAIQ